MSKRVADKYLTDQNWEEEDEPQEAGVFQQADKEVLKNRVMKKAKRRTADTSSSGSGAFAGFGGLTSSTGQSTSNGFKGFTLPSSSTLTSADTSSSSKGGFTGFGSQTSSAGQSSSNGFKGFNLPSSSQKPGQFSFNKGSIITEKAKEIGDVSSSSTDKPVASVSESPNRPKPTFTNPVTSQASDSSSVTLSEDKKAYEYNRHLSALNKSVSRWIADHVNKNPLCDLTPVFKDYEKHLNTIDEKYGESSQSECDSSQGSGTADTTTKAKPTISEPASTIPKPEPASKVEDTKFVLPKGTNPPTKPMFGLPAGSSFKGFGTPTTTTPEPESKAESTKIELPKAANPPAKPMFGVPAGSSFKGFGTPTTTKPEPESKAESTKIELPKATKPVFGVPAGSSFKGFGTPTTTKPEPESKAESTKIDPPQATNLPAKPVFGVPSGSSFKGFGTPTTTKPEPQSKAESTKIDPPKATNPPAKPVFGAPTGTGSSFQGFGTSSSKPSIFGATSSTGFTGFQFGGKPVSGSFSGASSSQADSQTSKEEEYVPPKPEVEIVKEEDAFYTKKCKLFYMKDGEYADKGVGHLHLKPVPSSNKTQLIVRAETALGNLLLNIVLNSAMPVKKQGKNNVAISCIPNPPLDEKEESKVTPMLIRVKTSEDADELEKLLNEKKKQE